MKSIAKNMGMLAVFIAALVMLSGMGSADDETVVSGNLKNTYTITAPATVSFGSFGIGAATVNSQSETVTLAHNYGTDLALYAQEKDLSATTGNQHDGFMAYCTGGAQVAELGSALVVGETGTTKSLTENAQIVSAAKSSGSNDITVLFQQAIAAGDSVYDGYALTITFSAQ